MYKVKEIPNRREVAKLFRPHGIGVEFGVETGAHALDLLEVAKPKKLYLVDWWSHQENERQFTQWREYKKEVLEMFAPQIATGQVEVHDKSFADFLRDIPDGYFDWAYLDGWHQYEHVSRDVVQIAPKVKELGAFAGHDFKIEPGDWGTGVCRAVFELVQSGYGPLVGLSNELNGDWVVQRGGYRASFSRA